MVLMLKWFDCPIVTTKGETSESNFECPSHKREKWAIEGREEDSPMSRFQNW